MKEGEWEPDENNDYWVFNCNDGEVQKNMTLSIHFSRDNRHHCTVYFKDKKVTSIYKKLYL